MSHELFIQLHIAIQPYWDQPSELLQCYNNANSGEAFSGDTFRMQVPGAVILTYSFWLWQRGCIKGIAKSWVFVKWRWMWWFGMKVIFYLGSDALCLVMQQPLSQQHDSCGKWILIRKGWCFFFPPPHFFFFSSPPPSPLLFLILCLPPGLSQNVPPSLRLSLCSLSGHYAWCTIKYDGWWGPILEPRTWSGISRVCVIFLCMCARQRAICRAAWEQRALQEQSLEMKWFSPKLFQYKNRSLLISAGDHVN